MFEPWSLVMAPDLGAAWLIAWQSTAVLGIGLLSARLGRPRPSRAHRILASAAVACLVVPPSYLIAGRLDLGLIAAEPPSVAAEPSGPIARGPEGTAQALSVSNEFGPHPTSAVSGLAPSRGRMPDPSTADAVVAAPKGPTPAVAAVRPSRAIGAVALIAWAVLSAMGMARLAASFLSGLGVVRRSCPVEDGAIRDASNAAARRLGIAKTPEVRRSNEVRCPAVWCWGRRPVVLIPEGSASRDVAGWSAVLCHELAHWRRRDHLSGLLGEVIVALLPWQPMAWMTRRRMDELGELACDDWALERAGVISAADYAETLLGMAAQGRSTLMQAAVSRESGLVGRVRHILEQPRPRPMAGRAWSASVSAVTLAMIAALALAQSQSARAIVGLEDDAPAESEDGGEGPLQTIEGVVRGPDGATIAGAEVRWVGADLSLGLSHVARPASDPETMTRRMMTLASGTTDAEGRFEFSAIVKSPDFNEPWSMLLADAPGLAPVGTPVALDGTPLEVALEPPVPIAGRLLTPGGEPASGVSVTIDDYSNGNWSDIREVRMLNFDPDATWDERPPFFPDPFLTDADGRFAIEGLVPSGMFAKLVLSHPDYAVEEITVATDPSTELTPELAAFSIRPVPPEFTHAMTPARPVVGRVTDAESGEPLAGITVKVSPMRQHGGMPIRTVTDAEGRYRVSDREGEHYYVTAYPDSGSGYLPTAGGGFDLRWPEGAAELNVDLELRRGSLLKGRVIDAESGAPIAGAGVVYQPLRGNPNVVRDGEDFRSPTLTDADGRFTLTGVPGPGVVVAEGPSHDYIRHKVEPADFHHGSGMYVHGLNRIDVPEDGELPEPVIELRKGPTLQARAVGPDGSSLERVRAWCPELTARMLNNWVSPQDFADGLFRLPGAEPGRTYRIFFLDPDREFGAVAEVVADPDRDEPIEVRLQPTATINGTVLDDGGRPIEGAQILPNIQLQDKGPDLTEQDRFDSFVLNVYSMFTDEPLLQVHPAEFRYDRLIPGVRYFVTWYSNEDGHSWRAVEPLEPGEVRDLGDIRAEPKEDGDDD